MEDQINHKLELIQHYKESLNEIESLYSRSEIHYSVYTTQKKIINMMIIGLNDEIEALEKSEKPGKQ